eukprot:6200402-Pleurochrysis_carterae.AAC.2
MSVCQEILGKVRERFGESWERLIAMLLCFDALFALRVVFRKCIEAAEKEAHAVEFALAVSGLRSLN